MEYNQSAVENLSKNFKLFYVQSDGKLSTIDFIQLINHWTINPNDLVSLEYRLCGAQDELYNILRKNLNNDLSAQMGVQSSMNYSEYINKSVKRKLYDDEYNKYKQWSKEQIYSNIHARRRSMADLIYMTNTKPANDSIKKRTVKSLQKKLDDLPQDKVLDVSNLKPDGTGVKTITILPRSKRIIIGDLKIYSSSFNNYLLAMDMLDGGRRKYADYINKYIEIYNINYPKIELGSDLPIMKDQYIDPKPDEIEKPITYRRK